MEKPIDNELTSIRPASTAARGGTIKEEKSMSNAEFIALATKLVHDYAVEHLDKTDIAPMFDVFVVWSCYILGHQKALLSTTLFDGMYYEVTYNSAKNEVYLDAYKKFENRKVEL